jgi:hypothetical protein
VKMLLSHFDKLVQNSGFLDDGWKQCQAVDISPAAQWYIEEDEREEMDFAKDFPNVASPWPVCWLEYKWPSTYRVGKDVVNVPYPQRGSDTGAIIRSFEVEDDDDERINVLEYDVPRRMLEKRLQQESEPPPNRLDAIKLAIEHGAKARWLCLLDVITETFDGSVAPLLFSTYAVDETGSAIQASLASFAVIPQIPGINLEGFDGRQLLSPFWFALSLLHCKNVKLEDVPVPPKVQAKREKRGIPNITFKTLIVEPMRQQVRREATDDPTGEQNHIRRALHIARGHFKDYRDGPGLFGKYQGLYWWDMHVRGSADIGTVVKDYQVKR